MVSNRLGPASTPASGSADGVVMAYKFAPQDKAVTSTAAFMGVEKDLGFIRSVGRLDGSKGYRH